MNDQNIDALKAAWNEYARRTGTDDLATEKSFEAGFMIGLELQRLRDASSEGGNEAGAEIAQLVQQLDAEKRYRGVIDKLFSMQEKLEQWKSVANIYCEDSIKLRRQIRTMLEGK